MAAISKVASKVIAVIATVFVVIVVVVVAVAVVISLNLAEQGKEGKNRGLSWQERLTERTRYDEARLQR